MVAQSDWLPMMIATGLAVMRAPFSAPRTTPKACVPDSRRDGNGIRKGHAQQKKARMYRNSPLTGKPIRLVTLVAGKVPIQDDDRIASGQRERGEGQPGAGRAGWSARRAPCARGHGRAPAGPLRSDARASAGAQHPDGACDAAGR